MRAANSNRSSRPSEAAGNALPIIAGTGYGTRTAIEYAESARASGADGLLLLPHYLIGCEQAGLLEHARAVCQSTDLPVIVYNRANFVLDAKSVAQLADSCPNFVGVKDGTGDLELVTSIVRTVGDRLIYIGGLPTAELFAAPYLNVGVTTYSSAVFNFLPEMAKTFYAAVRQRETAYIERLITHFFPPYVALRNRRRGFAVSIVKAGVKLIGEDAGPVRSPLIDLDAQEIAELRKIMDDVSDLLTPSPTLQ